MKFEYKYLSHFSRTHFSEGEVTRANGRGVHEEAQISANEL